MSGPSITAVALVEAYAIAVNDCANDREAPPGVDEAAVRNDLLVYIAGLETYIENLEASALMYRVAIRAVLSLVAQSPGNDHILLPISTLLRTTLKEP